MPDFVDPGVPGGVEQAVWRRVHERGSRQSLDDAGMAKLRLWTAQRMREQPFAVFSNGRASLRTSFITALDHAACGIADGLDPE